MQDKSRFSKAGLIGGVISASRLTPAQRIARATANGQTTLQRYGLDYYSALGKLSGQRKRSRGREI